MTWHADGHTVTYLIDMYHGPFLVWHCPFVENPSRAAECRIPYDDMHVIDPDGEPLPYCNVGEYISGEDISEFLALGEQREFMPQNNPINVEYMWSVDDETYVWRPVGVR